MSRTPSTFQLVLFPDNQGFSDECISLNKRNTAMEYPDSTCSMAVFVYSWPQMVATERLCLLEKLCLQERYCCWKRHCRWKRQKHKEPLVVDAKCLLRAIDAASGWKSLSKLRYFQPATPSPFQVLHQSQGDKPQKHTSSVYKVDTDTIFLLWRNVF